MILSNLAQVHINLENFHDALIQAQNGLKLEPNHVKCLYRCGVASTHLGNYDDAVRHFQKAKQLVRLFDFLPAHVHTADACQEVGTTTVAWEL